MTPSARTVVVGIGNEWRSDDGAGLAVARELHARGCRDTSVLEQSGDPNELLEALERADVALIVDSASSSAEPGSVHRLDAWVDDLSERLPRTSSHALGLADALELARTLGQLPETVIVYGIEGENFAVGTGLSLRVAAAVTTVVDDVRAELARRARPVIESPDTPIAKPSPDCEEPCTSRP